MKSTAASGPRRALVASFHYYPDAAIGARRVSELSLALASAGWSVTVVCARPRRSDPTDPALGDRVAALDVRRVPIPPKTVLPVVQFLRRLLGRGRPGARAQTRDGADGTPARPPSPLATVKRHYHAMEWLFDANKLWLTLACARILALRPTRRFDLVLSSGPPHGIHLAGLLAKRLFRAPWVMDMRDPLRRWVGGRYDPPEVTSRLRDVVEDAAARHWLHAADLVVCTAPGTADLTLRHAPTLADRVEVIYNGFDGAAAPTHATPRGRLAFLFAGSLYFNRDPFPFLEALKEVVQGPGVEGGCITLTMVGECESWAGRSVVRWIEEHDMGSHVRVLPRVPSDEARRMLADADVLVNFAQGQPLQIPAKTFEYLASGREALVIAEDECDTARLVRESGLGRVAPPGDRAAIARVIRELYAHYVDGDETSGRPSVDAARYSRASQNARYLTCIERLLHAATAEGAARPVESRAQN